jgi:hypothetical protein
MRSNLLLCLKEITIGSRLFVILWYIHKIVVVILYSHDFSPNFPTDRSALVHYIG